MRMVTTWDGVQFDRMSEDAAKKLEAEDKIQILDAPQIDGLAMKTRRQFTGYKTREMRAEKRPEPTPVDPAPVVPAPVDAVDDPAPSTPEVVEDQAPEVEVEAEVEVQEYSKLSVPELKALIDDRKLDLKGKRLKKDLVALLEADDE